MKFTDLLGEPSEGAEDQAPADPAPPEDSTLSRPRDVPPLVEEQPIRFARVPSPTLPPVPDYDAVTADAVTPDPVTVLPPAPQPEPALTAEPEPAPAPEPEAEAEAVPEAAPEAAPEPAPEPLPDAGPIAVLVPDDPPPLGPAPTAASVFGGQRTEGLAPSPEPEADPDTTDDAQRIARFDRIDDDLLPVARRRPRR